MFAEPLADNDLPTMDATNAFQYPPELLELLVEAIPRLCRSKDSLLDFFQGAGLPPSLLTNFRVQVAANRKSLGKYEMTRALLKSLNEKGDVLLAPRRELLKRVVEFEEFSLCWPNDRLEAQGLVSQIRQVVNVKDSFTRMKLEREREHERHSSVHRIAIERADHLRRQREDVKQRLFALFAESDRSRRGRALERVLNDLFRVDGILVRKAFARRGMAGEGVVEQIDGIVQFDSHTYLVELKWKEDSLGKPDVAEHLVRVYGRGDVRGLFVSYSAFTPAALEDCRTALTQKVVALCRLEEFVTLLNADAELLPMLRDKVNAAVLEKNPWKPYTS
jgi:hypothetical protein